jgi:MFS family permease
MAPRAADRPAGMGRLATATALATTLEWFDFLIYSTAAAPILGRLFFPLSGPVAGTLASFTTFAVGFLARPVGGIVAGHLADRSARKTAARGGIGGDGPGDLRHRSAANVPPDRHAGSALPTGPRRCRAPASTPGRAVRHCRSPSTRRWHGVVFHGGMVRVGVVFGAIASNGAFLLLTAVLPDREFVIHASMYGPLAAMCAEMFSADVRYSGASPGYRIAAVFGGFAPFVMSALPAATGSARSVSPYVVAISPITFDAALTNRETFRHDPHQARVAVETGQGAPSGVRPR